MLFLIAVLVMFYLGWRRWSWWTPAAAFAVALPVTLYTFSVVDSWRATEGLPLRTAGEVFGDLLLNLGFWTLFYGAGRLAAYFRDRLGDVVHSRN